MVSVIISKRGSDYIGLSFEGHAGFAKRGKDIVCAAVSVLVINTLNSLEKFTEDGFSYEAAKDGGYLTATFEEGMSDAGRLLLDSMCLGLENIEKDYSSKYIKLQYNEEV